MKFVITMNMPSQQGFLVHQVMITHESKSVKDFCDLLNDELFIVGQQFYKRFNADGESVFVDKGEIILNTSHIGKVQEYYDSDERDSPQPDRPRPPMRSRVHNQY